MQPAPGSLRLLVQSFLHSLSLQLTSPHDGPPEELPEVRKVQFFMQIILPADFALNLTLPRTEPSSRLEINFPTKGLRFIA